MCQPLIRGNPKNRCLEACEMMMWRQKKQFLGTNLSETKTIVDNKNKWVTLQNCTCPFFVSLQKPVQQHRLFSVSGKCTMVREGKSSGGHFYPLHTDRINFSCCRISHPIASTIFLPHDVHGPAIVCPVSDSTVDVLVASRIWGKDFSRHHSVPGFLCSDVLTLRWSPRELRHISTVG